VLRKRVSPPATLEQLKTIQEGFSINLKQLQSDPSVEDYQTEYYQSRSGKNKIFFSEKRKASRREDSPDRKETKRDGGEEEGHGAADQMEEEEEEESYDKIDL
jgi:hypothetical protein